MRAVGAELLIVSNASGGMNPYYRCGDLVVIEDHINLMGDNPLIGLNDDRLGPRFPDMCQPYDLALVDRVLEVARRENIVAHKGVFVAVAGPNLETRAEYRFLRAIGADVVGHVDGARGDCRGACRLAGAGPVHRHRHVSARRAATGQHRPYHRHRQRRAAAFDEARDGRLAGEHVRK